jgi:hypothetical protein
VSSGHTPANDETRAASDEEVVDAVPVLGDELTTAEAEGSAALLRRYSAAPPAVQAAAAAAGGFVAGAAFLGLVHRRQRRAAALARGQRGRRLGRRGDSGGGVGELVQIVGSRSLLVDVHLLGGPGGAR